MKHKIDVDAIADELSIELQAVYDEELKKIVDDEASELGKISERHLLTIEFHALKQHCERFSTELVKRVFESLK